MTITLAALTTQFLDRPGLTNSTIRTYEYVLIPLLQIYGRWSIEIRPLAKKFCGILES